MDDIIPQIGAKGQMGRYPLPWRLAGSVLWGMASRRPRSFAHDAQRAVAGLRPEVQIRGSDCIPAGGPCLVTCNHYSRPGVAAWWLALAISAAVAQHRAPDADPEIHWVMTAAWTFPGSAWRRQILTPVTRWAFERVSRLYGFVAMPPMPPAPHEVEARAQAVLRTVRLARRLAPQGGMVGLAPEGQDVAEALGHPPPGAGEFISLLVQAGLPVLPAGVTERQGRLTISFGPPFIPDIPRNRAERDGAVARQVMASITQQLS